MGVCVYVCCLCVCVCVGIFGCWLCEKCGEEEKKEEEEEECKGREFLK